MKKLFIMAPGHLEIPTNRGGGIEHNIIQLSKRTQHSSIIFAPRPRGTRKKIHNSRVVVKYSIVPAAKKYPLPPHISISNLGLLFMSIILTLETSIQILINLRKIDAVIIFDKFWGLLPALISRAAQKKRVYMEYNIWPWTYRRGKRSIIYSIQIAFGKLICKMSSIVTANSPTIKRGMVSLGIEPSRISILPTGIDYAKLAEKPITKTEQKSISILYVGRLVEERGADLLKDVIDCSIRINPNLQFRIAGGGPLFDDLHDFLNKKKL